MKIFFLAAADSANTRPWARFFKDELGHEIYIFTLHSCDLDSPGIPAQKILRHRWLGKFSYIFALPALRRLIREQKPDLIIGFRMTSYGVLGAMSGFRPLVLAAQNEWGDCPPDSFLLRVLVRFAIKRCDLINAWAGHMAKRIVEVGKADPEKVLVMPRGVDVELFKPAANRKPGSFTMIATRSLIRPYYNLELLIEALPRIREHVPEARLVLAGKGPDEAFFKNLAKKLGVEEHVHFPGMVFGKELAALLGEAELYLSPVKGDGVSASLLEAMSCGLFPIVTDHPSNRDWVRHGENGYLFPFGDRDTLVEKVVLAYEQTRFRERAQKANAALIREKASLYKNMKAFEQAYERLVAEAKKSGKGGDSRK